VDQVRRLVSHVQTNSPEFIANRVAMEAAVGELRSRLARVREGGPVHARKRHTDRGKLLPRARVEGLLDAGTPFLELSPLAADGVYDDDTPSAGVITGIGRIHGHLAVVIANDATVKGGTLYPLSVKKNLRAQTIAYENRLPTVYLVDSGGAFLPLQAEIFPDSINGGRGFYMQARMSAAGIPQIAVVMGSCTAGGAYTPAMCDENVIVANQGTIFLGGPPLVKAATGEEVSAEDLGGGDVHTRISGVADHLVASDAEGLAKAREIFEHIVRPQWPEGSDPERAAPEEPHYDPAELYGLVPADTRIPYDVREVIARLVDGSRFHEFKERYGTTIVTGFARLYGYTVGVIANNGVLFSESALKATHFIELCCQRRVPLLFLQNITGFMVGRRYEHGGITKDGAKLVHAVSNAEVPKLTVIVGASHGAGNYAMCGRAFSPRLLFMWPNSRISVMGGEQAANTLVMIKAQQLAARGESLAPELAKTMHDEVVRTYEQEGSPYYSTARLWDDGILDPLETRQALGLALDATLQSPIARTVNGVFRM
jgi:acetyl-CoA carboxylase carboxyltransferase component